MCTLAHLTPSDLPQGYMLAHMPLDSPWTWHTYAGLAVQLCGLLNVIYADNILINLRKPGEQGALKRQTPMSV